jgi:hypothetical protein
MSEVEANLPAEKSEVLSEDLCLRMSSEKKVRSFVQSKNV